MLPLLLGLVFAFAAEIGTGSGSQDQDAASRSPFLSDAARCGSTCQANNSPDKHDGASMCGRAVQEMVQCMSRSLNSTNGCTGRCGDGKDFVNCEGGQMKTCGYEKATNMLDKRCSMPGAVLAYTQTPTYMGQRHGHVEMVCGVDEYCSMYSRRHDQPWPRPVPDGCWFPKGSLFAGTKDNKGSSSGGLGTTSNGSSGVGGGGGSGSGGGGNSGVPAAELLVPLMRQSQQPTRNVQRAIQQRPANGSGVVNSVVDSPDKPLQFEGR